MTPIVFTSGIVIALGWYSLAYVFMYMYFKLKVRIACIYALVLIVLGTAVIIQTIIDYTGA